MKSKNELLYDSKIKILREKTYKDKDELKILVAEINELKLTIIREKADQDLIKSKLEDLPFQLLSITVDETVFSKARLEQISNRFIQHPNEVMNNEELGNELIAWHQFLVELIDYIPPGSFQRNATNRMNNINNIINAVTLNPFSIVAARDLLNQFTLHNQSITNMLVGGMSQ